jgi:hypothetical protein
MNNSKNPVNSSISAVKKYAEAEIKKHEESIANLRNLVTNISKLKTNSNVVPVPVTVTNENGKEVEINVKPEVANMSSKNMLNAFLKAKNLEIKPNNITLIESKLANIKNSNLLKQVTNKIERLQKKNSAANSDVSPKKEDGLNAEEGGPNAGVSAEEEEGGPNAGVSAEEEGGNNAGKRVPNTGVSDEEGLTRGGAKKKRILKKKSASKAKKSAPKKKSVSKKKSTKSRK